MWFGGAPLTCCLRDATRLAARGPSARGGVVQALRRAPRVQARALEMIRPRFRGERRFPASAAAVYRCALTWRSCRTRREPTRVPVQVPSARCAAHLHVGPQTDSHLSLDATILTSVNIMVMLLTDDSVIRGCRNTGVLHDRKIAPLPTGDPYTGCNAVDAAQRCDTTGGSEIATLEPPRSPAGRAQGPVEHPHQRPMANLFSFFARRCV